MERAVFEEGADIPQGLKNLFENSNVSLTIADFKRPDCPLIGANKVFFDICGYSEADTLGKNCRFLQPESGAGPVTSRMRRFLADSNTRDAKFLVPNETKSGEPFLNLVYLSKLTRGGETALVLGSQFRVGRRSADLAELYDRALREDLRKLNLLTSESNWIVLGSFEALASSHSIIAQSRIE